MILKRPQIKRALDKPDTAVRMFLLYGADESGSRELAARLGAAMPGAERIDLTGAGLKVDPARLPEEAASMSLFGDPRYIRVEPAGDEIIEAAEALLQAPAAGNPVVVVAGALRKESKLLKLATMRTDVVACVSHVPDSDASDRIAMTMGASIGLRIGPDVARRLVLASGGDRAILSQEIGKFALYLDAAPDRVMELDGPSFDALSADAEGADLGAIVNATLDGDMTALDAALARIDASGEAVLVLRAVMRRVLLLSTLRAEAAKSGVEAAVASAGKAVFWKEKGIVAGQVARWTPAALARAAERLGRAERAAKSAQSGGAAALGEELFAIGRQARRQR